MANNVVVIDLCDNDEDYNNNGGGGDHSIVTSNNVDILMDTLMSMGYSRNLCELAISQCTNTNEALDWLAAATLNEVETQESAVMSRTMCNNSGSSSDVKRRKIDHDRKNVFKLSELVGIPTQYTLRLSDLLYGDMRAVYVFNYLIDLQWLSGYIPSTDIAVTVIHGSRDVQRSGVWPKHWRVYLPYLPQAYSCHHTKMMLIRYTTGLRVVIHTNNMIERDWRHKSQGVWTQDFPLKSTTTTTTRPVCAFENDLMGYLSVYSSQDQCQHIDFGFVRNYDFSLARVVLIPSVPGSHLVAKHEYGQLKARHALMRERVTRPQFSGADIVCQYSSMGALTEDFLYNQLCLTFCGGDRQEAQRSTLKLIWPTVEDVRTSYEGYDAGSAIPCTQKNMKRVKRALLHKWNAQHSGRQRAMPHIKSYTRPSIDGNGELPWLILTSANMSKAAWGNVAKSTKSLRILHYEMGVLFLPSMYSNVVATTGLFSCTCQQSFQPPLVPKAGTNVRFRTTTSTIHDDESYWFDFPLPHSVYPRAYAIDDDPWVWDVAFVKPDVHGKVRR